MEINTEDKTRYHWGWAAALAVVVLITIAVRYALPIRDGDIWWHMLYGQYFLEHRTLIADHTIFSWTPSINDTIYCTWLPDIFFFLLYKVTGLSGLFAFRYLCLLIFVLACLLYARKLKIASHPLTWFVCLLGVIMSYTAIFVKPEIISFVLISLTVWNWWHIRAGGEKCWKHCYLFPVLMLIWVNSHGAYIFGLIFLCCAGGGEILNTWLSPHNVLSNRIRKHLVIAGLFTLITPFLTPYGYHFPVQLFFGLLPTPENIDYNSKIAAYNSPFSFEDTFNFALSSNIALVVLIFLFCANFRKIEWSLLLTNLIFAILYTKFFRTTFYWAPIFLFSSIYLLAQKPLIVPNRKYSIIFTRVLPLITLISGIALSVNTIHKAFIAPEKSLWVGFGISEANPVMETLYIKKYYPHARIGNTYDQGAYLLWELWPENKVFFDSRHFPFRDWSDDFFSFSYGKNVQQMTEKYSCDLWCIGHNYLSLGLQLLNDPEWKIAYYGKNASVFVRRGILLPESVSPVNPAVYTPKNLQQAMDTVAFSTNIGDFQTAEKTLSHLAKTFTHKSQRKVLASARFYVDGLKAYQERKYARAAYKLEKLSTPSVRIQYIITNCYQFLTLEAWEKNDYSSALKFAEKSLLLVPENPYSLYNLGVIKWQMKINLADAGNAKGREMDSIDSQTDWSALLQKFMIQFQADKDFEKFHKISSMILEGKQTGFPPLLMPAEPVYKYPF